ncbi:MAG: M14 family zinc carboxypeptidase [Bacteroidota bacterium]
MDLIAILDSYNNFKEKQLKTRFLKHHDIVELMEKLPSAFQIKQLGSSVKGKSINLIKWGNGKTKVMLWSQMHGDEATGTMALFDLFNFLQTDNELVQLLATNCQLFFIPMVNPDGAAQFTRRNAQQIDINRDFIQCVSPEAQLLKQCRADIEPEFGFNLHDQNTLWSVAESLKPATLSFLAPAIDPALSIDPIREKAMLVIADIFEAINPLIPGHIGLFDDEFEPRAFGDNFQKAGTSTILIEAGGYVDDPEKQEIRKFYFAALLKGLASITKKNYLLQNRRGYNFIPKNNKQIFHILIHGLLLDNVRVSVGINYDECPTANGMATLKTYSIEDIGDLNFCDAYRTYSSDVFTLKGNLVFNQQADFELWAEGKLILSFQNGKLL